MKVLTFNPEAQGAPASWSTPPVAEARAALERRIRERLGDQAAAQARSWLDDQDLDRLRAANARLPYVEDVAALVDPAWKLPAEPVTVLKLALHAFGMPMAAGVLLELRPGGRLSHRRDLFGEIPWLAHLGEAAKASRTLATAGWLVLSCTRGRTADMLTRTIDSKIVKAFRLGSGVENAGR